MTKNLMEKNVSFILPNIYSAKVKFLINNVNIIVTEKSIESNKKMRIFISIPFIYLKKK